MGVGDGNCGFARTYQRPQKSKWQRQERVHSRGALTLQVTSSTFLDDLIDARVTAFDRVDADDVNQAPAAIDAL